MSVDVDLSNSNVSRGGTLEVGDTLEISLETDPSSGRAWSFTNTPDKSILKGPVGSQMPPESPSPGVARGQVLAFDAVGKGWTSIHLSYADPSGGKPKRESVIRVKVI